MARIPETKAAQLLAEARVNQSISPFAYWRVQRDDFDRMNASTSDQLEYARLVWREQIFNMRSLLAWISTREAATEIGQLRGTGQAKLRALGYSDFRERWKTARQLVSLQGRLFIEQILWDMGEPWSSLVTGFKPVGSESRRRARGEVVEGSGEGPPSSTSTKRSTRRSTTTPQEF